MYSWQLRVHILLQLPFGGDIYHIEWDLHQDFLKNLCFRLSASFNNFDIKNFSSSVRAATKWKCSQ